MEGKIFFSSVVSLVFLSFVVDYYSTSSLLFHSCAYLLLTYLQLFLLIYVEKHCYKYVVGRSTNKQINDFSKFSNADRLLIEQPPTGISGNPDQETILELVSCRPYSSPSSIFSIAVMSPCVDTDPSFR